MRLAISFLSLILSAAPALAEPSRAALRELNDLATHLYREGKYHGASEAWETLHALAPSPEVIFNLAQVNRRIAETDPAAPTALRQIAAGLYRQYLALAGKGVPPARRRDIEGFIKRLAPIRQLRDPFEKIPRT